MKKRIYLPNEIISQIITLAGLDLKSMIRCMVVSKQWRNLVPDLVSTFISNHYKGQFLVYNDRPSGRGRFGALDEETNQIAWMCGIPQLKTFVLSMSSCNSLVCYLAALRKDIYICNPLTGEYISIPSPQRHVYQRRVYQCNLGFCSSSNQYKLTCLFECLFECTLETYTLGSSTGWRSVPFDHQELWSTWKAAICVDGVFHWLLRTESILTFDLANEVLGTIPPPRLEDDKRIYGLTCMDRCLVVTVGYMHPLDLHIWVRKEDKSSGELVWIKNWVIDVVLLSSVDVRYYLMPRKLSTDGRLIMSDDNDDLYSYDSRDKLVKRLWKRGFCRPLCSYYTPTLMSPKKFM